MFSFGLSVLLNAVKLIVVVIAIVTESFVTISTTSAAATAAVIALGVVIAKAGARATSAVLVSVAPRPALYSAFAEAFATLATEVATALRVVAFFDFLSFEATQSPRFVLKFRLLQVQVSPQVYLQKHLVQGLLS